VTGPIVLDTFRAAGSEHGYPASTLTDNGLVYTARFAGGRGGRNGFEAELLIAGRDIRILTEDGQLLRQLILDPTRDYQARPRTTV
jgi:hypothetical protein